MKYASLLVTLGTLLAVTPLAISDQDGLSGPNRLRHNPAVLRYLESPQGVPQYVTGKFADKVARGTETAAAYEYFNQHKASYRMADPRTELEVLRVDTDLLGMRHVRMQQRYKGLRVIGGDLTVHFSADDVLKTVNGRYRPSIELEVVPGLTADDATALARADLQTFFGDGRPDFPELVVFPWEETSYLAWRLFLYSDSPMGRWEYFVDATTGAVIYKANRIMDVDAVGSGIGVMGAERNHIDADYTGSTYQLRDYTRRATNNPHGHDGLMPSTSYIQTNLASTTLPGAICTDADNYWSDATTQRPAVDGHVYTALMYDYLLAEFGRNGYNDAGATMLTVVNYSAEGDNNAYWDGSRIVIWSWSTGWRSLAGCPDVIAHEWGHAVTEYGSNLVYQKESGALNESFSDMIGAAYEFHYDTMDTPDWYMGENGRTTGVGFRNMANPHEMGDPDTYGTDPYWINQVGCTPAYSNDYCGVHTNSGVGNKWFYLLSDGGTHNSVTVTGIGVANAMQIAYRANMNYWNSTSDYASAAIGTMDAADDLDPSGLWAQRVAQAWTAVNVSVPVPGLSFAYPDGIPPTANPNLTTPFRVVIGSLYGGALLPGSAELHYAIDGGAWINENLTAVAGDTFTTSLPILPCNSTIAFYMSARLSDNTLFEDPSSADPHVALSSSGQTVVFADNFETNKGWTVTSTATDGQWSRGVPVGAGDRGDPPADYDGSGQCYLTDNVYGNSDVDGGATTLISPTIDLSTGNALVSYARWFSNNFGDSPFEDVFVVSISNNNGTSWVVVETVGPVSQASGGWFTHSFWVSDFVTPTSQIKVRFVAEDAVNGSVVEAAVDAFEVTQYACTGAPAPAIETATLPDWTAGLIYSQQLVASGGTGIFTWSDKNNSLAGTGLTLSTAGLLSGTPAAGPVAFIALVTDENMATDEQVLSFTVNAAVAVTNTALPNWTAGVAYSQPLAATGGTGARTFADKLNQLAGTGLSLNTGGLISGTPTAAGPISFTALVTDALGATGERTFAFTVNPAVAVTTATLPDGRAGEAFTLQLAADGGTGTLLWTEPSNVLAGLGLTLSSSGLLSGTPTDSGTLAVQVRAADQVGSSHQVTLTLHLAPAYVCGDVDGSGSVIVSDLTYFVNYLFKGGTPPPVPSAANTDGAGGITVSDLTRLVNFLFKSGSLTCL